MVVEFFWEKTGNSTTFPSRKIPDRDEIYGTKVKNIGKKSPKPKGVPGFRGVVGLFWEKKGNTARKPHFPAFWDEVYAVKAKNMGELC